ncbi:hypothetical protein KRX11_01660 [Pasteurellaceae bacterium TAE3-ERU1]|uniref:hypothetical protein n=1 Tax=Spirabiliibacterium mucosae TaxID=28156 RepID=UPI001AAC7A49|nr:hypothetical protein [Spirabiliibacterium mucosae]MBE2898173.1 hypothetical protein [Spirabiliibacterium mucosae]MBV7387353.1 hypothetical protein [Pasteurellaceae bacterium TAE3-ERU1]
MNFTAIIQDCVNFMRNQKQMTLFFIVLQAIIAFTLRALPLDPLVNESNQLNPTQAIIAVAGQVAVLVVTLWLLNAIMQVSRTHHINYAGALAASLKQLLPFLLLNLFVVLPLTLAILSLITGAGGILGLVAILLGGFMFVRLSLAPYAYVIDNLALNTAMKRVWQQGTGRMLSLFLFTVIAYILPSAVNVQLARLGDGLAMDVISTLVSSTIAVFSLIFTYRFYHQFMQRSA